MSALAPEINSLIDGYEADIKKLKAELRGKVDVKDLITWLDELASDLVSQGDTYGGHIIRSAFDDLREEFQK